MLCAVEIRTSFCQQQTVLLKWNSIISSVEQQESERIYQIKIRYAVLSRLTIVQEYYVKLCTYSLLSPLSPLCADYKLLQKVLYSSCLLNICHIIFIIYSLVPNRICMNKPQVESDELRVTGLSVCVPCPPPVPYRVS